MEEYKKPEYQVTVMRPRACSQGNSITAIIQARYFFGEPVAGAKVKYVVHTSQHWWWDEDQEDESSGDSADAGADRSSPTTDADCGANEQQEHEGVLDANGRLTVQIPTRVDDKHNDQDYRIEARVTDAADREVSGHTHGAGDLWLVPRECGAGELSSSSRASR